MTVPKKRKIVRLITKQSIDRYGAKPRSSKEQLTNKTGVTNSDDEYEVGYGKPPKSGQFKPGQSGNKKGRPKGRKNFETEFLEELYEKVPIKENGKETKVSKQRLVV